MKRRSERPEIIRSIHLSRKAVIYIRQSTEEQVQLNTGSTAYQRDQRRYPEMWGWPDALIEDFDGDLGRSGGAAEHRVDYQRLLREIQADQVGAIFLSDLTRAGRNSTEWSRLIDLCQRFEVLIVVDGKVYDPTDHGEMLITRILASLGEHENMVRRAALMRGRIARARQGHAVSPPPAGYERMPDGSWKKSRDPQTRQAIETIFREFLKHRSCRRTLDALKSLGVILPIRKPDGSTRPAKLQVGSLHHILTNPAYKGEYHFGRRKADPRAGRDGRGYARLRRANPDDVIITRSHHEPYVSPEDWERVQSYLKLNAPSREQRSPGPGSALLQGIFRCGLHRNRAFVSVYKKERRDGGRHHTYNCTGDYSVGEAQCGWIAGEPLDHEVAQALIERLSPPTLDAVRAGLKTATDSVRAEVALRKRELQDARRVVAETERRFFSIDPDNRLVAIAVEKRLEEAKRHLSALESDTASRSSQMPELDDEAFEELKGLCADLGALWRAPTTTHFDRKQILRLLVERVTLLHRDKKTITVEVTWVDGSPATRIEAARIRNGRVRKLLMDMASKALHPEQIAKDLNDLGILTHRGQPWCVLTVRQKLQRMRGGGRQ